MYILSFYAKAFPKSELPLFTSRWYLVAHTASLRCSCTSLYMLRLVPRVDKNLSNGANKKNHLLIDNNFLPTRTT